MRKAIIILLGLVGLAIVGFFVFAPAYIEKNTNVVDGQPLIEVSGEAKALHATLTIVDLHSDTLLWKRSMLDRADRGHVDLPRLQDGNVALQIFSSVTKSPEDQNYDSNPSDTDQLTALVIGQMQPVRTWGSLLERTLYHAEKLDRAVADSDETLVKVTNSSEIDELLAVRGQSNENVTGAMFSAEGLHSLEGDIANLQRVYDAGMRMAGLTHFFDNELAGSMHGEKQGGLTDFGRDVMRQMEDKGMIVDIAHCSQQCVADVIAMARRPIVSSHGGVQATCEVNRNLSDEQIRGLASTGGIIGVGYWEGAVCSTDPRATARAMKHIRDLVGIEHVALGSDYDGAVTVRFDTSQLAQMTQALMDEGFSEAEIRAAMGENALRVLREGLIPLSDLPPAETIEVDAE